MLRVDFEDHVEPMCHEILDERYDAIVISDYDKGFLTSQKIDEIVTNSKIPVFIDSTKTSLPKSHCFIKINDSESKLLVVLTIILLSPEDLKVRIIGVKIILDLRLESLMFVVLGTHFYRHLFTFILDVVK